MASSRQHLSGPDYLIIYGAVLAVPVLVYIPVAGKDAFGWGLPLVALGVVCVIIGSLVKRRRRMRSSTSGQAEV
jgi:cytochrome c-type biogenesis protein CcmH/NrfF